MFKARLSFAAQFLVDLDSCFVFENYWRFLKFLSCMSLLDT